MKNLLTILAFYDITNVQDNKDFIMNVVLPSSYNVGDTVTLYGYTYEITAKVQCNICGMSVNNNKKLRNK